MCQHKSPLFCFKKKKVFSSVGVRFRQLKSASGIIALIAHQTHPESQQQLGIFICVPWTVTEVNAANWKASHPQSDTDKAHGLICCPAAIRSLPQQV